MRGCDLKLWMWIYILGILPLLLILRYRHGVASGIDRKKVILYGMNPFYRFPTLTKKPPRFDYVLGIGILVLGFSWVVYGVYEFSGYANSGCHPSAVDK